MSLTSYGQDYLNIDSYGEGISAGLEENFYAFANAEFKDEWIIGIKTSVYTEAPSRQLFITSFSKDFNIRSLNIQMKALAGGQFYDGFRFASISCEFNYALYDFFSISFNPMLIYYSNQVNVRIQTGTFINIYKERVNYFIKYGPPVYVMNENNSLTSGILFKEGRLKVSAGLQVPDTFEFKYTRMMTSFIYSFKYATADTEVK